MSPQTLEGSSGKVQGHQHLVVQKLDESLFESSPPDARVFQFFKGINDVSTDVDGQVLSTIIPKGTFSVAGLYRFCTMTGSATHQPILSPLLKRGPLDDCIRIRITVNSASPTANVAL